jgi:signal transduction histidine kinase
MDLMRARVALRERPLLDVFDLSVRFCAAQWRRYAVLSLIVVVPAFAVSWAMAWWGGWWAGWLTAAVLWAFADAPFVVLASKLVFADDARIGEALGIALRKLGSLIAVRIVQLLALSLSALMMGLPWIWLGSIMLFVVEVVVLEDAGVGTALGRAQRVCNANFGAAFSTMGLMLVFPVGMAMLADVAGRDVLQSVLEIKPPKSMFDVGGSWLALAGLWATLPLLATTRFFAYLDTRTRTEGWDIQTKFAGIASRAEEELRERAERDRLLAARSGVPQAPGLAPQPPQRVPAAWWEGRP